MDIVTLGAALNGSAEYVNSHFKGGSNIQIVDNPDGTQTINASGEVSSEDTVARADIATIKDGEILDSFGDVETALATKANTATTYTKTEVDTALDNKVDKVSGKGLSTNDYTTAEKTKLAGIAEGAEVNEIEGIKVNSSTVNPDVNKVVNITVPTTAADVSALPDTTKYAAALSLTINNSTFVITGQLKDQNGDNLGTAQTIDLPLESVVVGGSYNNQTKKVVLTLQNGNTIEFSVADLVSGLQTELSASNKLNPAYINYDSAHRAVSDTEKSTWNSKQNALSSTQLDAVNSDIDSTKVEQIETNKNNILSIYGTNVKNLWNVTLAELKQYNAGGTWSGNVYTIPDTEVTATFNSDGTITINGTPAINKTFNLGQVSPKFKGCIFSACPPTGGSRTTYVANVNFVGYDEGNGLLLNNDVQRLAQIELKANYAFNNLVFSPMICTQTAWNFSRSYQPYAPSNTELYAMIQALQAQLNQ